MAASLHLARYSPRAAVRMLRRARGHRMALERIPGLAAARVCLTAEFDPVTGGTPKLLRWALLCGWEGPQARDEFVGEPLPLGPFTDGAEECWSVALDAVRVVQGGWRGWTPSTEGVERLAPDEPMAVITYGKVRPGYLSTFHWGARKVARQLDADPANLMHVGLMDTPLARSTFTVWRSEGDAVRFAYGDGDHNPIQRHAREADWGRDYFFARFRPVSSNGTWGGRDPLAAARD